MHNIYGKVLLSKRLKTKYRAWNGTEMIYLDADSNTNQLNADTVFMGAMREADKDGQLIYLGDIVEGAPYKEGVRDAEGNCVVSHKFRYTQITDTSRIGFSSHKGMVHSYASVRPSHVRVIGNVYEHPDLLKKLSATT